VDERDDSFGKRDPDRPTPQPPGRPGDAETQDEPGTGAGSGGSKPPETPPPPPPGGGG
jgi:hypothetical protein